MREARTRQSVSSPPKSKHSNSKRQIWMSRPLSYRRSPAPDVSISMRMRSTISSSSTISRGTFRSTEVGILALRQHSRRAITEPVQDSVGPLATDSGYLVLSLGKPGTMGMMFGGGHLVYIGICPKAPHESRPDSSNTSGPCRTILHLSICCHMILESPPKHG
jgi:hypothetical protein